MPPDPSLSTRALVARGAFLGGALGAAGGLVVAGSLADARAGPATVAPDPKTFFPLVLSATSHASPQPQRLVFALSHSTAKGIKYASGPSVTVRFRKKGGDVGAAADARATTASGCPKGRGVYVARPILDSAGRLAGRGARPGPEGAVHDPGEPTPRSPSCPGRPRRATASPTTTDTLGVDPICTRDPMCPLHTQSLSTVIGAGKPVAALFATPARCQSPYCAPVLDEFLDVIKPLRRPDRAGAHRDLPEADRHRARSHGRGVAPPERAVAVRDRRRRHRAVAHRRRVRRHRDEGAARRARLRPAEPRTFGVAAGDLRRCDAGRSASD